MLHQDKRSPGPLAPKTQAKLHLCWKESIKRVACLNIPMYFQCDNEPKFKNEATKLVEKHNADIRRTTTKYKHIHTALQCNLVDDWYEAKGSN